MTLKDRLSKRKRPTATYRIRIDDTAEAERELTEARTDLHLAKITGDADGAERAHVRVEQAEDKISACYEPIELMAMKPDDFEALLDVHPPRPDTDDEAWNADTFPKSCFLECAPKELSEDEWEEFLKESCSDGEQVALFNTAIAINVRVPDPTVPKDLMGILG